MYTEKLRTDYTLSDAFHALGKRLYGKTWLGYEIFEPYAENPRPLLDKIKEKEHKKETYTKQIAELTAQKSKTTNKQEITELNAEINKIREQLSHCNNLEYLQGIYKNKKEYFDRYTRKQETEKHLINAFINEEITVLATNGYNIPIDMWKGEKGFKYYIDLSLLVIPRKRLSIRRLLGFIEEAPFQKWLALQTPIINDGSQNISPEQKCAIWLKSIAQNKKIMMKEECKEYAVAKFGVSVRGFNRKWAEITPDSWRESGRPKK